MSEPFQTSKLPVKWCSAHTLTVGVGTCEVHEKAGKVSVAIGEELGEEVGKESKQG